MPAHPVPTPPPTQPSSSRSGFAILLATMALLFSVIAVLAVAFKLNDMHSGESGVSFMSGAAVHHHAATQSSMMGGSGATGTGIGTTGGGGAEAEVNIVVKSDEEHAKRGPEGAWHDAFLPADFSVDPGATVKVTILNYDEGEHSFTSPMLGLNVTIAAGTPTEPATTTFTFKAPTSTGNYMWFCAKPCDPWAMSHNGYMRGFVRVA
jgi:plastocyanin